MRSAPLATLQIGSDDAAYDPTVPIETRVEREPAPFDMTLHMQASRYLAASARVARHRRIGFQNSVERWPLTARRCRASQ